MTWVREQVRPVALGDWSLELRDDDIARIRFRGGDVLRSVRAVVRDRDWATAAWRVASVDVSNGAANRGPSVDARGEALAESAEEASRPRTGPDAEGALSDIIARARVILRSDSFGADLRAVLDLVARGSALTVSLELTTARDFETNRTGLVVLHSPSLAGSPLAVEHASGGTTHTAFPTDISPHQPAFDIASLSAAGMHVAFEGEAFEMEDQRNWTDASYKTYSRPLSLPFPYPLAAGETVRQSVTVTVDPRRFGRRIRPPEDDSGDIVLRSPHSPSVGSLTFTEAGPMPAISVGASTAPGDGPAGQIGSSLLVELDLGWSGWRAALARASGSGVPLDVRLVLPEAGSSTAVTDAVRELAPHRVARVAVFQPAGHDAEHVTDAAAAWVLRTALAERNLAWPIIGGARSHFTELNREQHRLPDDLDGVVFSTTPLFHTLETLQLEESIPMQRLVAEQATRIASGVPVHVGPITLRTHVNNVATTAPPRPVGADLTEGYGPALLDADDGRQTSPELAAWTIASAAALTVAGVASLSYFEEWGPRGIRDADGTDYPVADAIRALADLDGSVETAHTADGKIWAIRSAETLLVANIDAAERAVDLDGRRVALAPRSWSSITL